MISAHGNISIIQVYMLGFIKTCQGTRQSYITVHLNPIEMWPLQ
jgi:hypothetical protein